MGDDYIEPVTTLSSIFDDEAPSDAGDQDGEDNSSTLGNYRKIVHRLSYSQNVSIGVYLVIAGVLTIIGNGSIVGAFVRFRNLLKSPFRLLILHLCLSNLGMALLGGFIFSGTSSLAERWLFGPKGCQYYAFTGFLFGNADVTFICVMAVTICLLGMAKPQISMTKSRIRVAIYFVWIWSLFWSICPLLGWPSYGMEPSGTTCTINWTQNDRHYASFMACLASFVFFLPVGAMGTALGVALRDIRGRRGATRESSTPEGASADAVTQLKRIKMCLGLGITCVLCWSGYAILCLWVIFDSPKSVPVFLAVLPPLFAKLSILINPVLVILYDDKLRQAAFAFLLCKETPPEIMTSPESARMTSSSAED